MVIDLFVAVIDLFVAVFDSFVAVFDLFVAVFDLFAAELKKSAIFWRSTLKFRAKVPFLPFFLF